MREVPLPKLVTHKAPAADTRPGPVTPCMVAIDGDAAVQEQFVIEELDESGAGIFPREASELVRVSVKPTEPPNHPSTTRLHEAIPVTAAPARSHRRNSLVAALGLAVLAQGGVMTYWVMAGGALPWSPPTGTVRITSEPEASRVAIDGAERGRTPLSIALSPGAHTIVVGTGVQARSQDVSVTGGGDVSMHVQLPPQVVAPVISKAALQIATEPPGARVWVDGEPRGVAPLTVSDLDAGDHAVTVRNAAGTPINRTVSLQEGGTQSLVITMPATGAFSSGWLAVSSPVPLQVMEKGALLGTTDMARIMLSAGEHQLELLNPALGLRLPRTVTITGGRTATVTVTPPRGTLSINALPWAEVWINGQRVGETPIGNYSLSIGNYEVVFRHPELGEQRRTITVGAQGPTRVGVDMKKP